MSGFRHDIAGGNGDLIADSVQSPNYAAGSAGWQISKSGKLEANDATMRATITASTFEGTDFVINSDGAFFYSGTPAAGNLAMSVAPTAGTDAYGNSYIAGHMVYSAGGTGIAAGLNNNILTWWEQSGSSFTSLAALTVAASPAGSGYALELFTGDLWAAAKAFVDGLLTASGGIGTDTLNSVSGAGITVDDSLLVGTGLKVAAPSVNADTINSHSAAQITLNNNTQMASGFGIYADTWQAVTAFANSWASGGTCQVKKTAEKSSAWLQMYATAGTLANGTTIATLPAAAYYPAQNQFIPVGTANGTSATNGPFIRIDTSGVVTCWYMPAGTGSIRVNGLYALD